MDRDSIDERGASRGASGFRVAAAVAVCLVGAQLVVLIVAAALSWSFPAGLALLNAAVVLAVGLPALHVLTVPPLRARLNETLENNGNLRAERDRLALVLERIPIVPYLARLQEPYLITFAGPQIEHLTGFTADFLADCPGLWLERVHPTHRARVARSWSQLLESGTLEHEYLWCISSGEYRWLHDSLRLLRDTGGEPVSAVGTIHDITEWKAAWDTLGSAREELRKTVRTFHDEELPAGDPVGSRWGPLAKLELQSAGKDLERARREVLELRGLLPVCAHCTGARLDPGVQTRTEAYLQERPLTHFADTLCEECLEHQVKL